VAYRLSQPGNFWRDAFWSLISFTAFFWCTAALSAWRLGS
jgi:hypothetical protein